MAKEKINQLQRELKLLKETKPGFLIVRLLFEYLEYKY